MTRKQVSRWEGALQSRRGHPPSAESPHAQLGLCPGVRGSELGSGGGLPKHFGVMPTCRGSRSTNTICMAYGSVISAAVLWPVVSSKLEINTFHQPRQSSAILPVISQMFSQVWQGDGATLVLLHVWEPGKDRSWPCGTTPCDEGGRSCVGEDSLQAGGYEATVSTHTP